MFTALAAFHPGHGTTEPSSVLHYVAEPVHAMTIVVAAVALIAAAGLVWRLAFRKA